MSRYHDLLERAIMESLISFNEEKYRENSVEEESTPKRKFILKLQNIDFVKSTPLEIFKFLEDTKLLMYDIKDIYNKQDLIKFAKKKELYENEIDIFNFTFNDKFLERNDIKYLESLSNLSIQQAGRRKSIKINESSPLTRNIDFVQFFALLKNSKSIIKQCILEFCDIYTLARIGLVNKNFYEFIFKYCNLSENIQMLCEAIFKWSGLYINYHHKLIEHYENSHTNMINNRPRVFYSGIYTEKLLNVMGIKDRNALKKVKMGEDNKNYFRIFYFLPNGEVYSIVSKYNSYENIYALLKTKKKIEVNKFNYQFDVNDNLEVYMNANYFANSIFHYNLSFDSEKFKKGNFIATFKVIKLIYLY